MIEKLSSKLMPHRFWQLSLFLTILLLTLPLYPKHWILAFLAELVFLDVLLVCLSAIGAKPGLKWVLVGLWLASVGLYIMGFLLQGPESRRLMLSGALSLYALFLTGCTAILLSYIFQRQRVTGDTIFAAVVAYLLMALIFANLYGLLALLVPDSFIPPLGLSLGCPSHLNTEMVYFSLVTISTVGYGGIIPHLPFAQMLAGIEAVIGQLYMSVLIAWLVGLHVSQGMFFRNGLIEKDRQEPLDD